MSAVGVIPAPQPSALAAEQAGVAEVAWKLPTMHAILIHRSVRANASVAIDEGVGADDDEDDGDVDAAWREDADEVHVEVASGDVEKYDGDVEGSVVPAYEIQRAEAAEN